MNPDFYVIIRRATPGHIRAQDRFCGLGGGWTNKPHLARTFASREAASQHLAGRPGEIVTAQSIGLEVKP